MGRGAGPLLVHRPVHWRFLQGDRHTKFSAATQIRSETIIKSCRCFAAPYFAYTADIANKVMHPVFPLGTPQHLIKYISRTCDTLLIIHSSSRQPHTCHEQRSRCVATPQPIICTWSIASCIGVQAGFVLFPQLATELSVVWWPCRVAVDEIVTTGR